MSEATDKSNSLPRYSIVVMHTRNPATGILERSEAIYDAHINEVLWDVPISQLDELNRNSDNSV